MDIAWLILDSLSFDSTPFNPEGENTMPKLADLADESGVVYTNAYVPGPTSPSSHGSFFTGRSPSVTGMHEAYPYFDTELTTIGDALSESHNSLLISANPYIFNGLQRGFDTTSDLRAEEYMIFPTAKNPAEFVSNTDYDSKIHQYIKYLTSSSKPVRSGINALQYKRIQRTRRSSLPETSRRDENQFQYAGEMNARIRAFVEQSEQDTFVVANYMDIHPPLDASDEAIERFHDHFTPDELPIGIRGQDVYERFRDGDEEIAAKMQALLKATIWDTDRKIAPLVESLLDQGAFVVVTADHGNWFRRDTELDEERIHVPLIIFAPDEPSRCVDHTVSLKSLPRTTLAALNCADADEFQGRDLLRVQEDGISVTEFIHIANQDGKPVNPSGDDDGNIRFDMAAIQCNDRLDYIDTNYHLRRGDDENDTLRKEIESRLSNVPEIGQHDIEYDETVRQRLEDFGYL